MKGIEFQINTLLMIVLFLAILIIAFIIISTFILPSQSNLGTIDAINRLCPDWQKTYSCTCGSASSLTLKVGTDTKSLATLCAKQFNKVNFDEDACNRCKQFPLCGGCPK